MNEILYRVLAFAAGLVLGALFFGGLWLTIKKAATAKIPAIWFLVSFIIRMGVTLAGFYYFAADNWQRMLVCTAGFIAARLIILRVTKTGGEKQIHLKQGGQA